jgi:hypothetical protein
MGGDYYDRDIVASNLDFSATTSKVGVLNNLRPSMNPRISTKDESSSMKCDNENPTIFGPYVTGSIRD